MAIYTAALQVTSERARAPARCARCRPRSTSQCSVGKRESAVFDRDSMAAHHTKEAPGKTEPPTNGTGWLCVESLCDGDRHGRRRLPP